MSKNDDKLPHIRSAVENDQRELDRHSAESDLRWPLKKLAANFIRIVRGAGRPEELGIQCANVVQAYRDYHEKLGEWPSSFLISEILSIRGREYKAKTDRAWEWEDGIRQMVAGGLQVQRRSYSNRGPRSRQANENCSTDSGSWSGSGAKTPRPQRHDRRHPQSAARSRRMTSPFEMAGVANPRFR